MATFAILVAAYPAKEISKATAAIYFDMLNEYDDQVLLGAIKRVIKQCKYFPTVAEISEAADELKLERDRVAAGLDPDTGLPSWNAKN